MRDIVRLACLLFFVSVQISFSEFLESAVATALQVTNYLLEVFPIPYASFLESEKKILYR